MVLRAVITCVIQLQCVLGQSTMVYLLTEEARQDCWALLHFDTCHVHVHASVYSFAHTYDIAN